MTEAKKFAEMTKDELIKILDQLQDEKKEQAKKDVGINLAQKIAKANKDIGAISKDGSNNKQNYAYQSIEAIRAAVRKVLGDNGLAIFPSYDKPEFFERKTQRGGSYFFARVMGHFTITDGIEKMVCDFPGEGSDSGDKAIQKACTSAQKYFYKGIFNISDRDEEDPDSTDSAPGDGYVANANSQNHPPKRYQAQKPRRKATPNFKKFSDDELKNFTVKYEPDNKEEFLAVIYNKAMTGDKVAADWWKEHRKELKTEAGQAMIQYEELAKKLAAISKIKQTKQEEQ